MIGLFNYLAIKMALKHQIYLMFADTWYKHLYEYKCAL